MLPLWILLAGGVAGLAFGIFGAGGSAFATPLLALAGVHPLLAVASPLPAVLPASFAGARQYLRSGQVDRRTAGLAIAAGLPATIAGATLSRLVGGPWLLVLSGLMLGAVGVRMLRPAAIDEAAEALAVECAARRNRPGVVMGLAATVGFLAGLLANGGGFLLVPVFVLLLGLSTTEAAGTSMVAIAVLTIPTLGTHWLLGHIDWTVAAIFAVGLIPASMLGARLGPKVPERIARPAFGILLVAFSLYFLARTVGTL